jgi:hypothetical protein
MAAADLCAPVRARAFQTTDGRLFQTKDEAARHQAALNFADYCRAKDITPEDLAAGTAIAEHGEAFTAILKPFRKRPGAAADPT